MAYGLKATNDDQIKKFLDNPYYEVLRDGRIFSTHSGVLKEIGYVRNPGKGGGLYKYVRLSKKSGIRLNVHRIIFARFGDRPLDPMLVINHKDGNGLNNHIDNLEMVTQGENNAHRFRSHAPVAGHRKITHEIATEIREMHAGGLTYREILKIVRVKYNIRSKGTLSAIMNRKTWNKPLTLGRTIVDRTYNQAPDVDSGDGESAEKSIGELRAEE